MARPRTFVEAPPVTPLPFGLFSAALVLDDLTGKAMFGTSYEPAYCGAAYDSLGVCTDDPDFGTASVSVDNTGLATLTVTGAPAGDYTIEWGDDTQDGTATPDGSTHQYAAPGEYVVLVTDREGHGYVATTTVTVTEATATGPFDADVAFSKVESSGIDQVEGDPFNLYHLFRCTPVGRDDLEARARTALSLGEQRATERVVASLLPLDDNAVDLTPTPGTAVHPVDGVALLEGYAAANYGGVPVIHTPRAMGTRLGALNVMSRQGSRLETTQGALVASGGGYADLVGPGAAGPADAGEAWLYVTGQVVVRRGAVASVGPVMARSPQATNDATVLVERPYVASWECIVGAVLVRTPYGVPQ